LRFLAGKAMEKLKRKAPAKDVAAFLQAQLQEVSR
jgi:Asp-tRNA(Asn)/Glu-tRNA(Gln) amidotransferase B subunit